MKVFCKYILAIVCCGLIVGRGIPAVARVLDSLTINDMPMGENLCALTFDDGPCRYTPQLLDSLREYGIPATFFLLGGNAERYPDVVRRMIEEGHEVNNHSYSHPNLRMVPLARKNREIRRTDAILRSLGAEPRFLRPPYGAYDEQTVEIAEELGLSLLLWSVDSKDWRRLPSNYALLRDAHGQMFMPGTMHGIFLFHDIHKNTVDDLPRIVEQLTAAGCQRFVTVSEYLEGLLNGEPGLLMTRAPGLPARMPLAVQHEVIGLAPFPSAQADSPMF
ncbi:MAG: polysaccharide deacetylase family protein [Desulfovibrio sp.]|jgi:peptidoglycan/xylan/chitin deacetylase (PgdA/CDA1 family)|nr:polysaccharide deacetylase family protein [Desulfovibrio sp.]